MGLALYRKYRPKSFSETVGQEAVTDTLNEAIRSGRISHAYLFSGPRGVGKTSIARILAYEVNQLPYRGDDLHLDIIEIDAASNRRIDEIRDLREKIHVTPSTAKYKVYIIDEVHMLTKEAFNALLKTLEEPPAHIIFILATTEIHKLPETIISRTQRFNFKPVGKDAAKIRLKKIAKAEKIRINDAAIELLTEFGDGSLRDVIGMLDQLSTAAKEIDEKEIREFLGLPPLQIIDALLEAIGSGNPQTALELLDNLKEKATSPAIVAKSLSDRARGQLLAGGSSDIWLTAFLKDLINVSSSASPQETLELAVLEATSKNRDNSQPPKSTSGTKSNTTRLKPPAPDAIKKPLASPAAAFTTNQWDELLKKIKARAPSLYTALRLADPSIDNDTLDLAFAFPLHQKKAQEARHLKLIGQTIEDILGAKLIIKCRVNKELADRRILTQQTELDSSIDLKAISNIFGSAEVLES